MNPDNNRKYLKVNKAYLAVGLFILAAFLIGIKLGTDGSPSSQAPSPAASQPSTTEPSKESNVKSIVTYVVPDGWKEADCNSNSGSIHLSPDNIDCNSSPPAPVAIAVDPGNTKDCNQLQNAQEVKKHTCISMFINGRKSLKSSTEYLESSSYKKATTVNAYYIDTGSGVVKVSYTFNSDNQLQAAFDQFANSVNPKS